MKATNATMGAFEAKNRFSELLERVGRGAEITITKHNRAVAKLMPADNDAETARAKATAELKAMRRHYNLKDLDARELIDAGRR
jgi:prevent-host-death family protein